MFAKVVHIEKKKYAAKESAKDLIAALIREDKKKVSVAQASMISGLPLKDSEEALLTLTKEYPSRMLVTESGDLIFEFHDFSKKKKPSLLKRTFQKFREWIPKVFPVISKITIAHFPALLFLSMAGNIFAISGSFGPKGPSLLSLLGIVLAINFFIGIYLAIAGLFFLFWWTWTFLSMMIGLTISILSFHQLTVLQHSEAIIFVLCFLGIGLGLIVLGIMYLKKHLQFIRKFFTKKKNFLYKNWMFIAGYILGAPPEKQDKLGDERILTALIYKKKGIITASDLMELFGWDYQMAETELTRILVDYGGDIGVTDKGAIIYRFDPLIKKSEAIDTTSLAPFCERIHLKKFFYCPIYAWIPLSILMILGLIGLYIHPKLVLFPGLSDYARLLSEKWDFVSFVFFEGLGAYIYLIAFGIPLIRFPFWFYNRCKEKAMIKFSNFIHTVYTFPFNSYYIGFYHKGIKNEILVRLKGDIDMDKKNELGEYFYIFPIIYRELEEAEKIRKTIKMNGNDSDRIVYDTAD